MTTTNQEFIESGMVRTVNRNLLKYAAGQAMFCPSCQTIMDYRRAVLVTVMRGSDTLATRCLCVKCWDVKRDAFTASIEAQDATVETIDGRKYK